MKQLCLQTEASYTGERIDKYLAEVMSDYSRSFLQKREQLFLRDMVSPLGFQRA